jgi:hypothetical protein
MLPFRLVLPSAWLQDKDGLASICFDRFTKLANKMPERMRLPVDLKWDQVLRVVIPDQILELESEMLVCKLLEMT